MKRLREAVNEYECGVPPSVLSSGLLDMTEPWRRSQRVIETWSQRVNESKSQRIRDPESQRVRESRSQRVRESESQRVRETQQYFQTYSEFRIHVFEVL